jgi:hypothetical protein
VLSVFKRIAFVKGISTIMQHKQKLLEALQLDQDGDWDAAHSIVQKIDTLASNSIHAYLHRKEPDLANARYWYNRVGKPLPDIPFEQEWQTLYDLVNKG